MYLFYQLLLFLAGALSLACGLLVVFKPRLVKRLNLPLGQMLAALQYHIRIERYYYRYHRITGPLTVLGGVLLCLAAWTLSAARSGAETWLVLQQALVISFALFGAGIIVLGLVVSIRPSALKPVEFWSNTVITRQAIKELVIRFRLGVVDWTLKYPRGFGFLAVLAGGILLILALVSL
ncbi:MAG: hypothetical protein R6U22_05765 [Desulfohalobiaceae bacterium]